MVAGGRVVDGLVDAIPGVRTHPGLAVHPALLVLVRAAHRLPVRSLLAAAAMSRCS